MDSDHHMTCVDSVAKKGVLRTFDSNDTSEGRSCMHSDSDADFCPIRRHHELRCSQHILFRQGHHFADTGTWSKNVDVPWPFLTSSHGGLFCFSLHVRMLSYMLYNRKSQVLITCRNIQEDRDCIISRMLHACLRPRSCSCTREI